MYMFVTQFQRVYKTKKPNILLLVITYFVNTSLNVVCFKNRYQMDSD
jgi:hypothetical protein